MVSKEKEIEHHSTKYKIFHFETNDMGLVGTNTVYI